MNGLCLHVDDLELTGYQADNNMVTCYRPSSLERTGYDASSLEPVSYDASDLELGGYAASSLETASYEASSLELCAPPIPFVSLEPFPLTLAGEGIASVMLTRLRNRTATMAGEGTLAVTVDKWSPLYEFGANLKAQYHADFVTTVSGNVSVWPDQSGNGANADMLTVGNRPPWGFLANGKRAVTSTGTKGLTVRAAVKPLSHWRFLHNGAGCCVALAWEPTSGATGNQYLFDNGRLLSSRIGHGCTWDGSVTNLNRCTISLTAGHATTHVISGVTQPNGGVPFAFNRTIQTFSLADVPDYRYFNHGTELTISSGGNAGTAPSNLDPFFDMTLLHIALGIGGAGGLIGGMRHMIFLDVVPTAVQRARLLGYLGT